VSEDCRTGGFCPEGRLSGGGAFDRLPSFLLHEEV